MQLKVKVFIFQFYSSKTLLKKIVETTLNEDFSVATQVRNKNFKNIRIL